MSNSFASSDAPNSPQQSKSADLRAPSFSVPIPLTPLVGRDHEIRLATSLLIRNDVRLLTLTGPGGIGKTRLGIRVAADVSDSFPDGVAFVALAAVTNAELVAATIAHSLGLVEEPGTRIRDLLVTALRGSEMLLVVDNFEHVLAAAPLLTDLLAACPRLKIMATCRSLLRVSGEQSIPVPPLDLPPLGERTSFELLSRSAAVELFVGRARSVDPSFALTESNAQLVSEICSRVDGLPLAIELAAAQIGILPLPSLLARIQSHLPLPVAGPRDAPVRLRSVRDAITWSYDLLQPEEQVLFRRFGVFVGGFSLESAEYLIQLMGQAEARDGQIKGSVLSILATLVESSLVRQQAWEGEPRFSMLEPIRGFALEELARNGEESLARLAHAEWCLNLAEGSAMATFRPVTRLESQRLDVETPNCLAALDWLERQNDADRVLRLAAALGRFWIDHGYPSEGQYWLERALSNPTATIAKARALGLVQLGRLAFYRGDTRRAEVLFTDAGAIYKERNDLPALAGILIGHGVIACQLGEFDRAQLLYDEALATAGNIQDPVVATDATASTLANMGVLARSRGDFVSAREFHERALRTFVDQGDTLGAIRSLCDLGDLSRDANDYAAAIGFYRECLTLLGDRGEIRIIRDVLIGTALAAAEEGRPESAGRLLGAAESLGEQLGYEFVTPADRVAAEQAAETALTALGDDGFRVAFSAGGALSTAGAIAEVYALSFSGEQRRGRAPQSDLKLSRRQREVLNLLAEGRSDREIADSLFISVRTAEGHVAALIRVFEVEGRSAVVAAAIVSGTVDAPQPPVSDFTHLRN